MPSINTSKIFKLSPSFYSNNVIKSYEKDDKNAIIFGIYGGNNKFIIKNKFCNFFKQKIIYIKNKKLTMYSSSKLRNLIHFDDKKTDKILRDIIDKFNKKKLMLFVCCDVNKTLIEREIYMLNDTLANLNRTIPLHYVENIEDLNKLEYSDQSILLGKYKIGDNVDKVINPKYPITIEKLVLILTGIDLDKLRIIK